MEHSGCPPPPGILAEPQWSQQRLSWLAGMGTAIIQAHLLSSYLLPGPWILFHWRQTQLLELCMNCLSKSPEDHKAPSAVPPCYQYEG